MKSKFIFQLFLFIVVALSNSLVSEVYSQKKFVVVLDAGHGGKDPGNRGNGYKEADIALKIILKIGVELEKDQNIKVIYTRKKNVFVELRERAAIANRADANLFVSVHCDAFTNNAYGAGTFVLGLHKSKANFEIAKKENEVIFLEDNYKETYAGFDPSAPESLIGMTLMQEEYLDQSILLATLVQNNFTNTLKRKNRSVKQAGFWVLHNTYMPSVLIETGFLTNKKEGAYLNSKKGQTDMAKEIAKAILSYRSSLSLATENSKNPVIEENEIVEAIENGEEKIYEGITFKVQLAASSKDLELKPFNFKGLKELSRNKEGGLFKYYYGDTSDYNKIQLMKTFAREKGYSTCYIVAFKENKKIKLTEVLQTED
ncbi:MAG: N-acetylmuramoyl-L-alanine amidase [Flavobacteriaceae bacterium]|jgi:N-acetylmuramoyl-L-alanine amidase|uniref:N-acetylmuramoyl-L-alanine amidase family protein n=1 Tax=Candidatus Marifrigoribacter sp. Uisw_064 TaxID=3230970 RepID=UPI003ADBADE9